ncbi:MAG: hypothetical protein GY796_36885, partial [Chloroflexi bacterium]|nr:hypothetical protein [Chloroflexota bacterium]
MSQEERLKQKIAELEEQWGAFSQKIRALRKELALETRSEEKLRLEARLKDAVADRENTELELVDVERRLDVVVRSLADRGAAEESPEALTGQVGDVKSEEVLEDARSVAHLVQQLSSEPPDPARQLEIYLQTAQDLCRSLPLGPLDPGGREEARVTLEQVYVALDAQAALPVEFEGQPGETHSLLGHVAHRQRLVVLGDPGSGKSTFLRFLALRLAQAHLQPDGEWLNYLAWPVYPAEKGRTVPGREEEEILGRSPWPGPVYVPVSVILRDFAATDFNPASPLALWHFIRADLTRRGLADTIAAVQTRLEAGQGIFLLDGVDEVPLKRRPQVWQAIGALAQGVFNRCPWLATCRILSYVEQEATVAGATDRLTLAALNGDQIKAFITAWYKALVEAGEKTPAQGAGLSDQLQQAA